MKLIMPGILLAATIWHGYQLTPLSGDWSLITLLLVTGLIVELCSVRVAHWTILSAGFVIYLSAANVTVLTATQSYFLGIFCLLSRVVLKWEGRVEINALAFLQDALPLSLGLMIHHVVENKLKLGAYAPGFLASLIFLPCYLLLLRHATQDASSARIDRVNFILSQVQPLVLFLVLLAGLSTSVPFLFLAVISLGSQMMLRRAVSTADAEHSAILEHRLQKTQGLVEETKKRYRSLERDYKFQDRENRLLQSLGTEMVQARSLGDAILALLGIVEELFPVDDVAFQPMPNGELIRKRNGLKLIKNGSSLATDAYRASKPKTRTEETNLGQKFRMVAISVGEEGALCLARRSAPFTTRDAELLSTLAQQAQEALASAHHHQREQQKSSILDQFLEASLQLSQFIESEELQKSALVWAKRIAGTEQVELRFEPHWHFVVNSGVQLTNEERQWLSLFSLLVRQILSNQRLHQELLEGSKDAAIKQIAACLAHELNTPFSAVKLQIEMATRRIALDQNKAKESLRKADVSLQKAGRILDGLLHFTTPYGLVAKQVELNLLIQDVIEREGFAKEVNLVLETSPASLTGYPKELEQLIKQLTQNSIDSISSMPNGEVRIQMRGEADWIYVDWKDNGKGVSPEIRKRIFEPFFTTKDVGEGLGLGLTLAREVATRHYGTLKLLESKSGAIFRLQLPVRCPESASTSKQLSK